MGNEAVYRERFDNVLRVVGQIVAGGGQHNGRFLDLTKWDSGPGGGACVMGLCAQDEWFQAHGYGTSNGGPYAEYSRGAPAFNGHEGGRAVGDFLDIDAPIFEALFCTQGYLHNWMGVTPARVHERIAEYIGYRFEGRPCSAALQMYIHESECRKRMLRVPAFLQAQPAPAPWMSMEFVGANDTATFTPVPPSMSYYVGSQLVTVPAMPTSPPFCVAEVEHLTRLQLMRQMQAAAAYLTGIQPPNIKPPNSMIEAINAMMVNA